jgi:transposase
MQLTRSIRAATAQQRALRTVEKLPLAGHTPRTGALREFHDRLRRDGKSPKITITACMRKVIVMLNAMLKSSVPFTKPNAPLLPAVSA